MTKGTHTYRGTQLGTQTPELEPVVSTPGSVNLTPEPVATPSSSKRAFSSVSDATASSSTTSSNKRARNSPSTSMAILGLRSCLESFANKVEDAFRAPLPPRDPPPSIVSRATNRLYQSITSSRLNEGRAWLSDPEVYQLFTLFSTNDNISDQYARLESQTPEDETFSRRWLRNLLENMACERVPGGSGAP